MKKILSLIAISALILALFAGCQKKESEAKAEPVSEKSSIEKIKERGTIKIAVFSDKKPFGYVDENGKYQGYDVYFAERIAADLGVKAEYVPVEAAARVEVLETKKVDLVLANFTVTPARAEKVDFALPYMKCALGVVSNDNDLIKTPEDLNGKTLIIAKGTTAETYFTEHYPEVKLLKFDQYAEAYNALLDGRGAALSTDNTEVLAWAIENNGFTVGIESLGDLDTIAPAVQKGNTELLNWINDEIKSLAKEQFFHADYEATLREVYGPQSDANNLVVEGGTL
ncbi:cysteine ABC transporter substrate-binding protein [Treponema zioleckii]|uniref:cysteine ABC transporter substrate-binding protein n=1 Tax=Treponema zioleckii TaxID=331680 RepID=UPI00168AFBDA|nr:cysteine ABC transporter substrate-binding protein [Treponema zioleckii]